MTLASFPAQRPRRLRRDAATRDLVREHRLGTQDLILPVFIHEGRDLATPVPSMPGVERLSVDRLLPVAEDCVALGIPVIALFPVIEPSLKTSHRNSDSNLRSPDAQAACQRSSSRASRWRMTVSGMQVSVTRLKPRS